MKAPVILTFILSVYSLCSQAQKVKSLTARNTVYLEILGSGALYSINYERLLLQKEKQAYGLRVGTSYFGERPATIALIGELLMLTGKGDHHGDFGLGLTGASGRNNELGLSSFERKTSLFAVPRLGYRYQKLTGGIMLRAGFTPLIRLIGNSRIFSPSLGLSIGHSF
ncbi:hypothetical protein [Spirosoma sordidisoli]|uniref:DUF3575 domain-containing protein n=1 Tax=Spirosoma sordidisoli TaxID=2502893 RepID=A0A4Q2UM32_9BACT|nr:hypothetical protein [Spirosoma sordidisoli]RYC70643.1 hypothetical protein EQG79_00385 [Spirosoma sordidisoli]